MARDKYHGVPAFRVTKAVYVGQGRTRGSVVFGVDLTSADWPHLIGCLTPDAVCPLDLIQTGWAYHPDELEPLNTAARDWIAVAMEAAAA